MNNLIEEKKAQSEKQMDEYQPNRANHFWREILWVTWQRKQGFTFPPGSLGNLPWCIARKRSVTTAPGKGAAIPWLEKGISKGRPTAWEKPQGTPKQPTADLEFAKQGEIPISFRKVRSFALINVFQVFSYMWFWNHIYLKNFFDAARMSSRLRSL
jgi:hypothetical protein